MTELQFNKTRFVRIMGFQAFHALSDATRAKRNRLKYPISMTKYFTQVRPTRLLTKCVLEYIRTMGHAEEVKTTGTLRKDKTGKMIWTYSQTMQGSAEIHAIINGMFYAIEIKTGKDRQSDLQKNYQKNIEASGAKYIIVKVLDDLIKNISITEK